MINNRLEMTPKQGEAIQAINDKARHILIGGSVSSAKSFLMAMTFLSLCYSYPNTRYAIGRKNSTTIRSTILQTLYLVSSLMNLRNGYHYTENLQQLCWRFNNGSQLWLISIDESKDRDFDKLKGLELTAGGIDEVNEVSEAGYNIFNSRVGRMNHNGEPQFLLSSCNPTNNWVKPKWYDRNKIGTLPNSHRFIQSLPSDNPYNSQEYLQSLEEMPEAFKERFVRGNWDYLDDTNSIFPLANLVDTVYEYDTTATKYIGVDVARKGADSTVLAIITEDTLVDFREYGDDPNLMRQVDYIIETAEHYGVRADNIVVDEVGLGAGVVDGLFEKGWRVTPYISGSKPTTTGYDMFRSEAFWKLSEAFKTNRFKIWCNCSYQSELQLELSAHTAIITPDKVKVSSKDKIRESINKSPDFADALSMAYSAVIKPKTKVFAELI